MRWKPLTGMLLTTAAMTLSHPAHGFALSDLFGTDSTSTTRISPNSYAEETETRTTRHYRHHRHRHHRQSRRRSPPSSTNKESVPALPVPAIRPNVNATVGSFDARWPRLHDFNPAPDWTVLTIPVSIALYRPPNFPPKRKDETRPSFDTIPQPSLSEQAAGGASSLLAVALGVLLISTGLAKLPQTIDRWWFA